MEENYIENLGWGKTILYRLRMAWHLLLDKRVPKITKMVPALVAAYVLSPVDLIPDALLGVGQLDDLAVFMIGLQLFINICPPEIVADVQRRLTRGEEEQVIDVEVINPHKES